MLFDLLFYYSIFFISFPLVTGYYARSRGRSFFPWFFLGLFFPIVSQVILVLLPDKVSDFLKDTGITFKEEKMMDEEINRVFREMDEEKVS